MRRTMSLCLGGRAKTPGRAGQVLRRYGVGGSSPYASRCTTVRLGEPSSRCCVQDWKSCAFSRAPARPSRPYERRSLTLGLQRPYRSLDADHFRLWDGRWFKSRAGFEPATFWVVIRAKVAQLGGKGKGASSDFRGLSRLIGRCSQYRALLLAFFKGLSQGSEFLFCGLGRPLLLMSVSAERARRLLRLTGGAAGLLCPSSRIRLPWPRWPACPSAIRLGRSGSHHLRFAHGRGPRRRRPIPEELGRDRTLGQDRETRLRPLPGPGPSPEVRP